MWGWLSIMMALPWLMGCQIPYITTSAVEQLKILAKRQPLEKVLADDRVSDEVKRKLKLAREAQAFAEQVLGLSKTGNYTSYVDLNRPYVSYIVHAAPAYQLEPYLWSFPIVGKVPYKGYFSLEKAKREAASFAPDKFDTFVRGVTAYSTLGWFDDPLLSTMMTYSDHDLVNTVIHESVHATVYIKGHADFNERLATFLGDLGTELFYRQKEGANSPTVKKIKDESEDQKLFSEFITKEITQLRAWYKEHPANEAEKKSQLVEIQSRYRSEIAPRMKTDSFNGFAKDPLNNAKLLSYGTYYSDLSVFAEALRRHGGDFKTFLVFCKNLEKSNDPERDLKEITESVHN